MDITALGALAFLAIADSGSFGTLLIPVWLLATPGRLRVGRFLAYLATVTVSYFGIGLALLAVATPLAGAIERAYETRAFVIGQLVVGIGFVVISHFMDNKKAKERAVERAASGDGKLLSWRRRILSDESSTSTFALMGLAATAVLLELATMLPYLAGIGIITTNSPNLATSIALLAGYCVVMIMPALVLLILRAVASSTLERPLERLDGWLSRNAQSTTAWIIGIVGVVLALQAFQGLRGA